MRILHGLTRAGLIIGCPLIIAACGVSTSEHEAVLQQLDETQTALDDCRTRLAVTSDIEAELVATDEALDRCSGNLEVAQRQLDAIRAENRLRHEIHQEIMAQLRDMIDAGHLEVRIENGRLVLDLPNDVLFDSGVAELNDIGRSTVVRLAGVLGGFADREFQVEGHTDNVPIDNASFDDNWELSTARALSVVDVLIESGVSPDNLSAAGYGEYEPLATNDTEDGRAKNRRIEIVLVPDLSELPIEVSRR